MSNTQIVGILNITPDSFSDGGTFFTKEAAKARITALIDEGAGVIDIGAESTRPGATPLTAEQEWQRLEPIIQSLSFPAVQFSIDTRHAQTAARLMPYAIDWINDVSGFSPPMIDAVKNSRCKLVVMHSLTVPADKNIVIPESQDVMETVLSFAQDKIASLVKAGINADRIIFDPGIGFGKTAAQSMTIIREIARFKPLGVPILIGHSRKSFLATTGQDRDAATLAMSKFLIEQGVDYIRVHDVAAHRKLISHG